MRLVLFDIDGTLVDSQATIHECMRRTFAAFGRAGPSPAAVRAIIGLSLDHAIERLQGGWHADIAPMTALYTGWRSRTRRPSRLPSFPACASCWRPCRSMRSWPLGW